MRKRIPPDDGMLLEIKSACRDASVPEEAERQLIEAVPVLLQLLTVRSESERLRLIRGSAATNSRQRTLAKAEKEFDRLLAAFENLRPTLEAQLVNAPAALAALAEAGARLKETRSHLSWKWGHLASMALPASTGERKDQGRMLLLMAVAAILRSHGLSATTTKLGLFARISGALLGGVVIRHADLRQATRWHLSGLMR